MSFRTQTFCEKYSASISSTHADKLHGSFTQYSVKSGLIVNDIKNFVFGPAKAPVYGFGRNRKQKFVMSFTISIRKLRACGINRQA